VVELNKGEVSLIGLSQVLREQKKILFTIWFFITFMGALYVLTATPVFKAQAYFLPPSLKDIQALNVNNNTLKVLYTPESIYELFVQFLKSRSNRRDFYRLNDIENKLGFDGEGARETFFEKQFNEKLIVHRNLKKIELSNIVSLSFEGSDAELTSQWVNDYVKFTSAKVVKQLVEEIYTRAEARKVELNDKLVGKLEIAKVRRYDRIIMLEEALDVAAALNEDDKKIKVEFSSSDGLALNTSSIPLYLLSEQALKAEITSLKNRKDDAPFVAGLRDLEESVATLNQLSIDPGTVAPFFLDQKSTVPERAIKPKKTLTVLLFSVIGLLIGLTSVFLRDAFIKSSVES